MAKCCECSLYPWDVSIDPKLLPVVKKCHPLSGPRLWTSIARDNETDCQFFNKKPLAKARKVNIPETVGTGPT